MEWPCLASSAAEMVMGEDLDEGPSSGRQYLKPEGFVMTMVKMHRCSYAQMRQGDSSSRGDYPLPDTDDPNFKAAHLGQQLTHGLNLLCQKLFHQAPPRETVKQERPIPGWGYFLEVVEADQDALPNRHALWRFYLQTTSSLKEDVLASHLASTLQVSL